MGLILKMVFSHVGLFVFLTCYCYLGALMFQAIEGVCRVALVVWVAHVRAGPDVQLTITACETRAKEIEMEQNVLQLSDVCKSFSTVEVLKNVSFVLRAGSILGLVGENGAGKSTLMNILGGVHARSSGEMTLFDRPYCPKKSLRAPATRCSTGVVRACA